MKSGGDESLTKPVVTIIVPYYNSEAFIAETLDSVREQTFTQWECLLIDDGSDDDSNRICLQYQETDQRFRYIKRTKEPKGVSSSRNTGIEAAKGEYLMFLDADDLLAPHCLHERVGYLKSNPGLDFAVFQAETFGKYVTLLTGPRQNYLESFIGFDFAWTVSSPLWRASFLETIRGFNTRLVRFEDPEFHIRALAKGPKFEVLHYSAPDMFYRIWKTVPVEKGPSYYDELQAFAGMFEIVPEIVRNTKADIRAMKNGLFLFITKLYPPVSSQEKQLLDTIVEKAVKHGIIGTLRYKLIRFNRFFLDNFDARFLQRLAILRLAFVTSPSQFFKLYGNALKKKITN